MLRVCPGIDLVFHGSQRQLEYDFVVAPGANPNSIRLRFHGADQVRIDATGDLLVRVGGQEMRQHKPVVYQESAGVRHEVSGGYVLDEKRQVGFRVSEYNTNQPLIIDPVLLYSTYLGGSGSEFDSQSVAVDASGSAYVTGFTSSIDFPTIPGAFQTSYNSGTPTCSTDAFVSKFNPAGSALEYSTYIGGNSCDFSNGISVDASGDAYITGSTDSDDFPVTAGALQLPCSVPGCGKGFITKLNPGGSALVYSATLSEVSLRGIVVDSFGNAFVAGDKGDAFVAKLNAAGSALVYATQFGGSDGDGARRIAIDQAGNAYVTGITFSSDFPTTAGAFQRTCPPHAGGPGPCFIAFVSKIDPAGLSLVYSTYLGGYTSTQLPGVSSEGSAIAVDESGEAYVAGIAYSSDFPTTPGAFQTVFWRRQRHRIRHEAERHRPALVLDVSRRRKLRWRP